MYYTGICSWSLKLESDPQNQWRGYWRVYSMDGVRTLDLVSGNLYSHPSSSPYPSVCLKKFLPSLDFSFLIYKMWKMNMWTSKVASQVPWIHWKGKLCLRWPDTIWSPHVGYRIIWGLAARMAAPGQGAAHSLCSSFRDLETWSHIATGSRQKKIGQPSSPIHSILQWCLNRKEHALGIWYISVFAEESHLVRTPFPKM